MDNYRTNLIIRVAKLYYELGMSQIDISKQEHLSKSTVSRLIKLASEMGFVKISIVEPKHSYSDLESEFKARFHLKKVTILPDMVDNHDVLVQDICAAAAEDLPKLVDDNSIVGVAWGSTMSKLRTVLTQTKKKDVQVVQLNGGVSRVLYQVGSSEVIQSFVDSYNGSGYLLPAPAIVDHADIANALKNDRSIRTTMNLAQKCQTAVFSVGNLGHKTALYQMGCFSDEEYQKISEIAVGDVCSHFIDMDGKLADPQLDKRVVATDLTTIRTIPNKVVIAIGKEKAEAILGAIHGDLIDYLYIDYPTAKKIIQLSNQQL